MNKTMNRIAVTIFAMALVAIAGCQMLEVPVQQPAEPATIIDEATKSKAVAAKEEMFKQLSGRLMEVMSSEGPVAAVEVCSEEASQFAVNVSEMHGVNIGRTALKLRNTNNLPPDWAQSLISETATEPQFVSIDDNTVGALMPIKLQSGCLACHGPAETIAPAVKDQLAIYYPDDTATGFSEGDLRGWFWVEVPEAVEN